MNYTKKGSRSRTKDLNREVEKEKMMKGAPKGGADTMHIVTCNTLEHNKQNDSFGGKRTCLS